MKEDPIMTEKKPSINVRVSRETHARLTHLKRGNMTYDDIIQTLLAVVFGKEE